MTGTKKPHADGDQVQGFKFRKGNLLLMGVMEATPPATPRHTMFPLWLLPSGSCLGRMQACSGIVADLMG